MSERWVLRMESSSWVLENPALLLIARSLLRYYWQAQTAAGGRT